MTSTSDHIGGAYKLFYTGAYGQLIELSLAAAGNVLKFNGTTAAPYAGQITFAEILAGNVWEGHLGAAAVSQSKLKTSYGEVTGAGIHTLPGGQYGFYPQIAWATATIGTNTTTYLTIITLTAISEGVTPYCLQRYVTSSGEVNWLFILRDKQTKEIKKTWYSPDHPCLGNGGDPEELPHPFFDMDEATEEVICINPTNDEIDEIKKKVPKRGSLLTTLLENYEVNEDSNPDWPDKDVTVGLPEGHEWHEMKPVIDKDKKIKDNDTNKPIKMKVPKPANVLVKLLKAKK